MTTAGRPLTYRLLTGPDDTTFCARVSQALAEGYQLHGSPALTFDGHRVVAAQAVVLTDGENAQDAETETPGPAFVEQDQAGLPADAPTLDCQGVAPHADALSGRPTPTCGVATGRFAVLPAVPVVEMVHRWHAPPPRCASLHL